MFYEPENFILEEWVSEDFFKHQFPIYKKRLWQMFDPKLLLTADMLRGRYGPCIMNTWHSKKMIESYGRHEWRGYRDCACTIVKISQGMPHGNISQHRFARAGDLVFLNATAEEVRKDIRSNPNRVEFQYIHAIESNVSWLHMDRRNWDRDGRGIFYF